MIPVDLKQGRSLAQNNVCAECGGGLVVVWGGFYGVNSHVLVCSEDKTHVGLERVRKPTFEELPLHIQNVLERKARKEMVEQGIGTDLAQYAGVTSLTEKEADHILSTIYRGAPRDAVQKAIWICVQYSLNPLMKHLFLLPFNTNVGTRDNPQWVVSYEPVMGINATRLLASRQGRYSYLDMSPRLMTDDEQTKMLGFVDPDNLVFLTILQNKHGDQAYGVGKYPRDGKPKGMDKGNTCQNMASIRSERNAFGKLFPAEMPRTVDGQVIRVMDEQFIAEGEEPIEDIEGDVIEGEVMVLPDEEPAPAAEKPKARTKVKAEDKPPTKCPAGKLAKIKTLMEKVSWDMESKDVRDWLYGRFQVYSLDELTESNADIFIASLEARVKEKGTDQDKLL